VCHDTIIASVDYCGHSLNDGALIKRHSLHHLQPSAHVRAHALQVHARRDPGRDLGSDVVDGAHAEAVQELEHVGEKHQDDRVALFKFDQI